LSAEYIVAPAALDDIDEIAIWMRQENPDSDLDLRFIDAAHDTFTFLAQRPNVGHSRPDLTDRPVLFWKLMRSFAVIYRVGPPVEIVRVRRWRQDLLRLLQDDAG
jgi:plasmid stabilization system protein ParE